MNANIDVCVSVRLSVYLNNNKIEHDSIKSRIGLFFLHLAKKFIALDMSMKINETNEYKGVLVTVEDDGSQWVMLEDYKKLSEEKA